MLTLAQLEPGALRRRLRRAGLALHTGPFKARISSRLPEVAHAIGALYAEHELADQEAFIDFEVSVQRRPGLRRFWRPQVEFRFEGQAPFNPLPGDQGFPLLEWGLNWCVYGQCHQFLILHAAVLERGGRAMILPAPSGSGKSTLCAGLLFSGWRLLSDELTLVCPQHGDIVPNPRPVSLKNESIDVISRFAPQVRFGSRVAETTKGRVAHFAAPTEALRRAGQRAVPGWVVLPRYVPQSAARLQRVDRARCFMHLVENAFNYDIFGAEGFNLLGSVIDRSDCYSFEYSSLPEAVALFNRLADGIP
jgi:HprK-related kinase A